MGKCNLLPIGSKIGSWTIVEHVDLPANSTSYRRSYLCRCEMGHERHIRPYAALEMLRGWDWKGRRQRSRCQKCRAIRGQYPDALQRKALRSIWSGMKSRCENSNTQLWRYYGAKGITVCDEWRDFERYYQWAIDNGWRPDLHIDRIDGTKGYSPENCRCVSRIVNSNNKSNNHRVTAFGETKTLAEWSRDERTTCSYDTLKQRINSVGWEPEVAIVASNNEFRAYHVTAFNETKTLAEWSRDPRCKCRYNTLHYRIAKINWNPEQAITTPSRRAI